MKDRKESRSWLFSFSVFNPCSIRGLKDMEVGKSEKIATDETRMKRGSKTEKDQGVACFLFRCLIRVPSVAFTQPKRLCPAKLKPLTGAFTRPAPQSWTLRAIRPTCRAWTSAETPRRT